MRHIRDQSYFIINNKRHFFYVLRDAILTLILWVLWFYLLYPLIAIIAWKGWNKNIYFHKTDAQIETIYDSLIQFFIYNGIFIPLLGAIFIGWGIYNRKRFGKRNRRKTKATPVTIQQLAQTHQVEVSYIKEAQDARYLRIYHVDESPKEEENLFPPLNEHLTPNIGKIVSMYFTNNWDEVRKASAFGTIHREEHIPLKKKKRKHT